jgi:mono/diheme cytochrome c family protein
MQKSITLLFAGAIALTASSLYAQQGDAAKGKQVFEDNCSVCHNSDSADVKVGPGLKGLSKKDKMSTTGKAPTDANILAKINEGGNGMPAYKDILSDTDKANVIAFLKTL